MSVFDRSYRRYTGELKGRWARIWSIATSTFRVQFSGKKIIFLLILCNLPMISFTLMITFMAIFFPANISSFIFDIFGTIDVAVYTVINFTFNPGLIFLPIVFVCALNAGTIANDKKHNSLALYMAKPIDRIDYIVGKALSIYMVSAFVTLIPWLVFLIAFTLLMGVSGSQFIDSLWVYLSTTASALIAILFLGSIVLMFSSMSNQSVLAGILSIMILFLPSLITGVIGSVPELNVDWLNYFSISSLLTASIHVVFGFPEFDAGLTGGFFMSNIRGSIAIVVVLGITIIAILITINQLYKEEIH
ncbi:MAG: ABC transporter permease subunit [Candidatus Heimdallarchaeota archaeon]|nr:ABC transporter permease subunit [Candidatus Heimdallarchaeota archaeon]MBY8993063.1 ABC transporter permease subunit [Candidatus Heimdallarchaeota archaeon]